MSGKNPAQLKTAEGQRMKYNLIHRDGTVKEFFGRNLVEVLERTIEDDETGYFFDLADADIEALKKDPSFVKVTEQIGCRLVLKGESEWEN